MSSIDTQTPSSISAEEKRLTGVVKWFNTKSGFGFITVCGTGEFSGKDIFVHYSSIKSANSQYKYLVQGEYVEFDLVKVEKNNHEYQATNISGIMGGNIMCETANRNTQTYRPRNTSSDNLSPTVEEGEYEGFQPVATKRRTFKSNTKKPAKRETAPSISATA